MRYDLIVFDWDGTLLDSAETIGECIRHAARELGLPVPAPERARHVIGLGLRDSLRLAVPDLPAERTMEFVESYRREFSAREAQMQLFPGAAELLGELRERGHILAVATGKSRQGLERALDATGLRSRFAASRCADETTPKPHPAMLHELMQALEASPERALMIGDTSHDLQMAAAAGVDAVAVCYGAHAAEDLRALEPRGCVHSMEELRRWLMSNA